MPLQSITQPRRILASRDVSHDTNKINNVSLMRLSFYSYFSIQKNIYVKRYAPSGLDEKTGHYTKYQTLVFNEADGFYHIDSKDGPLILAIRLQVY